MPKRSFRPNEVSAGGVVVRPAGADFEVCLVSDGNYWGLPKGIVEAGEEPEQTALREISEETGIARASLVLRASLPASEYVYRRRDDGRLIFKRVHHYLVAAPPEAVLVPDPAEIADAAWLPFDDAERRATFRDTHAALREARRLLRAGPAEDGSSS